MEVGTEISQKIRSAIKAKLLELGSYVDDELPDYIMVMVANKKSRSQMNSDLGLFLGANTQAFTEWLHNLLAKLQTIRVDYDKSADKISEKPKDLKEKRKDKERSRREDSREKKDSRDKGRSRKRSSDDAARRRTKSKSEDRKSQGCEKQDSGSHEEQKRDRVHESRRHSEKEKDFSDIHKEKDKTVCEKTKNAQEDIEDVRQLLVTDTPRDALAEELEKTEAEFVMSGNITDIKKQTSVSKGGETCSHSLFKHKQSPNAENIQTSTATKRRTPTSVITTVSRRDTDKEHEPLKPAAGTVASIAKVSSRKSSVASSLQANRALLLKAMTEAEQSIAVKRKVAVTKPRACDGSPSEAYSPKRRQSDHAVKEASPPLYIPSRKNSCDQSSSCAESSQHKELRVVTCDTAEPALRREDYGELISRSRREELLRTIGIDRDSSHQVESAISPQGDKRRQERDKEFTHKREVKEDRSSRGIKNFQITARVVSSDSGSVISDRHDNRKRQHSRLPEPRQALSLTVSPSSNKDAKTSITSRLGKVVVERRGSCDYEDAQKTVTASSDHSESNSWQRDVREDIIVSGGKSHPVGTHMGSDERIISSSSREAIREHNEASVTSVQPGQTYDNIRGNSSPDSRVVQSNDYVENSEDNNKEEDVISSRGMAIDELLSKPLKEVTGVAGRIRSHKSSEDTDDLAKMIDEDLGPELLEGTQNDEFTLDLDDDDISHVVADIETEAVNASEKVDRKSGIRFIVTLDGVDEGQFNSDDSSNVFERRKCPHGSATTLPVAPVVASNSNQLQLNQKLILNLLASQSRNASQNLSQQVQTLATTPTTISKLTPPKIQPFSISLKDSDDEHDDSKEEKPQASRQSFFHQAIVAEEENEASALKRAKMSERCKFWPACAAGASCEFHHPTTRCKTFPSCRFGEKCLFIHPNCKFDSRCARPDCPFTHTSRRPALAGAAHVIALPQPHFIVSPTPPRPHYATFLGSSYPSPQAVCRYFPNCQNVNCSYAHPKPCKFGASCKSSGCQFYHHSQPARDKLKWQAQCELPKTQSGISLDSVKMEPAVKKPRSSTLPSNSATVSSTSQ